MGELVQMRETHLGKIAQSGQSGLLLRAGVLLLAVVAGLIRRRVLRRAFRAPQDDIGSDLLTWLGVVLFKKSELLPWENRAEWVVGTAAAAGFSSRL